MYWNKVTFQTLIGILQTHEYSCRKFPENLVSNPYRYSTNSEKLGKVQCLYDEFQTLIGILQTIQQNRFNPEQEEFQTLIGILQTAFGHIVDRDLDGFKPL